MTEKLSTQQRMDKVVELIKEREKLQADLFAMKKRESEVSKEIYSLLQFWEESEPVAVMSRNQEIYIVSPNHESRHHACTDVTVKNVTSMMYKYYDPEEQ